MSPELGLQKKRSGRKSRVRKKKERLKIKEREEEAEAGKSVSEPENLSVSRENDEQVEMLTVLMGEGEQTEIPEMWGEMEEEEEREEMGGVIVVVEETEGELILFENSGGEGENDSDAKSLEWVRGESERAVWLFQNIQRLCDAMGMTFEDVEVQLEEMLGEIERRRNVRKKEWSRDERKKKKRRGVEGMKEVAIDYKL